MIQIGQKKQRVVDLCMWVDENAYKEDVDKEQLFDSLYNIVIKIAVNHKLFKQWQDYQPFGLYAAGRVYKRYMNPKQYLPDDDPKKMKKIKSVLNFIKTTLNPMRVDFQKEQFEEVFNPKINEELVEDIRYKMIQKARNNNAPILRIEFEYYLNKICKTVRVFLKTTPYADDKIMFHRLYVSCLMSLINSITLSNANKLRADQKQDYGRTYEDFINKVYIEEQKNSTVVWHLPESMSNYISTLVNRIKRLLVEDLRSIIGDNETSEALVQSILSYQEGEVANVQE